MSSDPRSETLQAGIKPQLYHLFVAILEENFLFFLHFRAGTCVTKADKVTKKLNFKLEQKQQQTFQSCRHFGRRTLYPECFARTGKFTATGWIVDMFQYDWNFRLVCNLFCFLFS